MERVGDHVFINGTVAVTEDGETFAPNDAYAQTKRCFEIVEKALEDLGADFSGVVRTKIFVTDIGRITEYGRAHEELFPARIASSILCPRKPGSLASPAAA